MKMKKGMVFILLILFFIEAISAVALSGTYTSSRHLEMNVGEVKEFGFVLQNMAGDKDIKLSANVSEGQEFVEIKGNKEYIVPLGVNNVSVRFMAEVPENAKIGDEYQVRVDFRPMPYGDEEEGGMVQFALGVSRTFKIRVVESELSEEKPGFSWSLIMVMGIGIIILIFVIYIVMKRRNKDYK